MNLTPEKEKVKRVLLTARTKQAAAPRPTSGKSAEADVLIVAVRHISFRDADEILSRWNAAEMGYVSISAAKIYKYRTIYRENTYWRRQKNEIFI